MNNEKPIKSYFILDSSGSLQGEYISTLNHTVEECLEILKKNKAPVTVKMLEFNTEASWLNDSPVDINQFSFNYRFSNGFSNLSPVLNLLNIEINSGGEQNLIIFITDGYVTDLYKDSLNKLLLNNDYRNSTRVAFALGEDADIETLTDLTGNRSNILDSTQLTKFSDLLGISHINTSDEEDFLDDDEEWSF